MTATCRLYRSVERIFLMRLATGVEISEALHVVEESSVVRTEAIDVGKARLHLPHADNVRLL